MPGYSITKLMEDIKATNNGRLIALSMTGDQKRMAEKAIARGLVKLHFMNFPGFGMVATYSKA